MKTELANLSGHLAMELMPNHSSPSAVSDKNYSLSLFKFHKILTPVDFTDCSRKALQYATLFAKQMDAKIIALHVLPVNDAPSWKYDAINHKWWMDGTHRENIEQQLTHLLKDTIPAGVSTDTEVRYGHPVKTIIDAAKELDVDLIIMSTHGYTGLLHALIGSVASNVARRATCPVLVVREHEHEFNLGQRNPFKAVQNHFTPAVSGAVV